MLEEISRFGILPALGVLTLMIVPLMLVHFIFEPCWECFDFEASAVHATPNPNPNPGLDHDPDPNPNPNPNPNRWP